MNDYDTTIKAARNTPADGYSHANYSEVVTTKNGRRLSFTGCHRNEGKSQGMYFYRRDY